MKIYKFGEFRLDAESRKLFRESGEVLPLTPRIFDLLLVLVTSNGRVLTKNELLETVWTDCIVEESNLSQSIFMLRKTLGETANNPRFIRTIPAQGYRFTAQVETETQDETPEVNVGSQEDIQIPEANFELLESANNPSNSSSFFRQNSSLVYRGAAVVLILISIPFVLYAFSNFFTSDLENDAERIQLVQLFTPATKPEGEILDISFSPDGEFIVFSSVNDGIKKIYSRRANGGGLVEITDGKTEDYSPIWSPDGLRITFLSKHGGQTDIRTISYLGGQSFLQATLPEPEASTAQLRKWSGDGEHIFVESAGNLETILPEFGEIKNAALSEFQNASDFSISPDEKTVVYMTVENGKEQLWMKSLAGEKQARKITGGNYRNLSPAWFPDNSRIAFSSDRTGDFQIYTIDVSGKNLTRMTFNNYNCYYPVVSPDGLKIFFKLSSNFDNN